MLTRGHRQEALSRAYVRAIAAQAGVTISEPENDYGIDMTLRVITVRNERRRDMGPQLDLQLKSTTRASIRATNLIYDLETVNYEDLRESRGPGARILVVFVMPDDESQWLSQSLQELILRHCAFWLSLRDFPPTTSTSTVRVSIPLTNIFSVDALQTIMQRLSERKGP